MRDKKTAILEYIRDFHTGRDKAVFSRELQFIFQLDGRNIRRNISKLRQEGYPICSDENGYYYADSQTDVDLTVRRMDGLIKSVAVARTGLLFSTPSRPANEAKEY